MPPIPFLFRCTAAFVAVCLVALAAAVLVVPPAHAAGPVQPRVLGAVCKGGHVVGLVLIAPKAGRIEIMWDDAIVCRQQGVTS